MAVKTSTVVAAGAFLLCVWALVSSNPAPVQQGAYVPPTPGAPMGAPAALGAEPAPCMCPAPQPCPEYGLAPAAPAPAAAACPPPAPPAACPACAACPECHEQVIAPPPALERSCPPCGTAAAAGLDGPAPMTAEGDANGGGMIVANSRATTTFVVSPTTNPEMFGRIPEVAVRMSSSRPGWTPGKYGTVAVVREGSHISFLREDHHRLFGSPWISGRAAFDYLITQGLKPEHKLLDFGAGACRIVTHALMYLNPGNTLAMEPFSEYRDYCVYEASLHGVSHLLPEVHATSRALKDSVPAGSVDRIVSMVTLIHLHGSSLRTIVQMFSDLLTEDGRIFSTSKRVLSAGELKQHCLREVAAHTYPILWHGENEKWFVWAKIRDCQPTWRERFNEPKVNPQPGPLFMPVHPLDVYVNEGNHQPVDDGTAKPSFV